MAFAVDEVNRQMVDLLKQNYIRILIVGDSCVGKSALLLRYTDDTFNDSYTSTIGIDLRSKKLVYKGRQFHIQFWDTAGQERFRSMTKSQWRNAHGVALVYAVDDAQSFKNVNQWMNDVKSYADHDIEIILLGNKCDVKKEEREVTLSEGQRLADHHQVRFMETSALKKTNVNAAFQSLVDRICERISSRLGPADATDAKNIDLNGGEDGNKKGCCGGSKD